MVAADVFLLSREERGQECCLFFLCPKFFLNRSDKICGCFLRKRKSSKDWVIGIVPDFYLAKISPSNRHRRPGTAIRMKPLEDIGRIELYAHLSLLWLDLICIHFITGLSKSLFGSPSSASFLDWMRRAMLFIVPQLSSFRAWFGSCSLG